MKKIKDCAGTVLLILGGTLALTYAFAISGWLGYEVIQGWYKTIVSLLN